MPKCSDLRHLWPGRPVRRLGRTNSHATCTELLPGAVGKCTTEGSRCVRKLGLQTTDWPLIVCQPCFPLNQRAQPAGCSPVQRM